MKKANELNYKELKNICSPNVFKFETTKELDSNEEVIGQTRGIKALEFGINVNIKGYNIYIEGPAGVGKTMYTKKFSEEVAKKRKIPNDWCYIYNFDNPNEPIATSLPAGIGKDFKETMDAFIKDIKLDIKRTFNNDDFEKEKTLIRQNFEDKRTNLLEKLNKASMEHGFTVKSASNGVYMMPMIDGKTVEEEDFEKLDENIKKEFEEKSTIVQQQVIEVMGQIKEIEKMADKKVEEWQANIALLTVNVPINTIKSKFKKYKIIQKFLDNIKQDVLKNISYFTTTEESQKNPQPNMPRPELREPWLNYRVNLFIDNSNLEGAPVIMDSNYSYQNIFGRLEYENQFGSLKTDHTMIKPGLLHKANGGFIVFQAKDLLTNAACWDSLKRALRIKELIIENPVDPRSSVVMVSLKPDFIPLDVKVIILGNASIYHGLLAMDDDFRKLFKVKVEFEDDAERNENNMLATAKFIHDLCEKEDFPHLNKEAMAKVIEYSSRITEDKLKITTQFNELAEIVSEACTWAKSSKSKIVTPDFIKKALEERVNRVKKYDQKYIDMIKDETLLIDTEGLKVGEINGLTIMKIGDYSFGKPSKITSNTYVGKSGIVNIEREIELSGSSHSKGVLILSGYLGEKFAQDSPLSLTASVCFEQLYNGVDGDSASSTELYAILSSLSEIPITQSIAVTGSVNQKGEIQPIGGVNEKIEGFFQICNMRGLNGQHGVIIPIQNVKNLHLSDEVIEQVKAKNFHIYAVSNIDEGIEILTGVPAGKKDSTGRYPAGSINYLAMEKLKKYAMNCREYR